MSTTHFYTLDDTEAMAAMANMQATSEGDPFWAFKQSDSDIVPMYRMMHVGRGTHFFTTFIDERDVAVNENGYQGEGIGFWCFPVDDNARGGVQQLFRLYNPDSDDHLYTLDPHEIAPGYKREGAACLVFSAKEGGSIPLFRLLSPSGQHFYTADSMERQTLLNQKYSDEGTCGFVMTGPDGALRPLFRSYNPGTGGHLYSLDIAEHDAASKNSGYRGDGISAYIWPDNAQPAGAVKLFRAYNAALDDHFYTIDTAEHAQAVQNLGYTDEGLVGWVLTPDAGKYNPNASPAHRLMGGLAEDFLLLPPGLPGFLSSSSNFYLTSEIGAGVNPIVGLDVELAITSDLTVTADTAADGSKAANTGMGFQLNAYSPEFYTSSWQQFGITLDGGDLTCEIQNWARSPYAVGFIVGSASLCHIGSDTLAKGYRLRVVLLNDEFANILGADFYVCKDKDQIAHKQLLVKDFKNGPSFGAAPIIGFQYVVVGPYDAETATLVAGGAGLVTYRAGVALCAKSELPSVAEWPEVGTGEQSNSVYGEVAATKSKVLTQAVSISATPLSLRRPATAIRMSRRPPPAELVERSRK